MTTIASKAYPLPDSWRSGITGGLIGLAPAFGEGALVALSLYFLLHIFVSRPAISSVNWKISIPLAVYICVQYFFANFHGEVGLSTPATSRFVIQSVIIFVATIGFSIVGTCQNSMMRGVIIGLMLSMLLLGMDYFYLTIEAQCRAEGYSGNPQWAAAFLVILVPPVYALWTRNQVMSPLLIGILVCATMVAVGAFTGTRMAFYGLIATFGMFFLFHFLKGEQKNAYQLFLAVLTGLILTVVSDRITACGFVDRIVSQIHFAPQIIDSIAPTVSESDLKQAPEMPSSQGESGVIDAGTKDTSVLPTEDEVALQSAGASRGGMWSSALESISGNIAFGSGRNSEKAIASQSVGGHPAYIHVHNQYLSWLIWGGIPGLLSGLLLLIGVRVATSDTRLVFAFFFPLGVILLSESLFALDFNFNVFIAVYIAISTLFRNSHAQSY